jgi:DNA topoisomerase IB
MIYDIETFTPFQQSMITAMENAKYKGRGVIQMTGRQSGKSSVVAYQRLWQAIMEQPVKIHWQKLPGRKLKAYTDGTGRGLRDHDMDEVQQWIWTNMPSAKRLSFDMWLFKEDKHITMFLMKWSS